MLTASNFYGKGGFKKPLWVWLLLASFSYSGVASAGCGDFFGSLLSRWGRSSWYGVNDSKEVKALLERPEHVVVHGKQSGMNQELSQLGYVEDFTRREEAKTYFLRQPELVSEREAKEPPGFISKQREAFLSRFGKGIGRLSPSNRERFFSNLPEYDHLLTVKTLKNIPPGWYSFVVLEGENFLRLGLGHPALGAGKSVWSAGEVQIGLDLATGEKTVTAFTNRSDTYQPMPAELLPALEAMWRQGINPLRLKIFKWEKKTLLLELGPNGPLK